MAQQRRKPAPKPRPPAKPDWKRLEALIPEALGVRDNAHAPYSEFHVGAALVGESGRVYLGCNVENASYGLTQCAERTAVGRAVADGERRFKGIVIVTPSSPPSPPCGMCRQVLREFSADLPVVIANPQGERVRFRLGDLLPHSFDPAYLD
jgi:cytidine deaminase